MKSIITFSDGSQLFSLTTGENATVEKGENGLWGFTTNKGYNSWEGCEGWSTKKTAVERLRECEKNWALDAKYDEQ